MASRYADDASISFSANSISTINNVVNKDLESLKTLLEENKLSLNVAKTHCFLIGSRNKLRILNQSNTTMPSIYIGDDKLPPITSIKDLRVQVDQYLNWEGHLLTIINKVFRGIGMLRLAKRFLPLETVQMMYRSLIEPYFRYCCPIWGSASSTNLQRLQKLHSRAARIVTDSPYDCHSELLIKNSVGLLLSN